MNVKSAAYKAKRVVTQLHDAIEVRLKVWVSSRRKSLLNFNHIQQLWDSFFQCHNSSFYGYFNDWLFVGRDDGTSVWVKKSMHTLVMKWHTKY